MSNYTTDECQEFQGRVIMEERQKLLPIPQDVTLTNSNQDFTQNPGY